MITAVCCFTPVLAIVLPLLGLASWLGWIDWVLFPLLGGFLLMTAAGMLAGKPEPGRSGSGERAPGIPARRATRTTMESDELTLITFKGCPNAARARELLAAAGRPYTEVVQDDLPPGHPQRAYTSPTILQGERIVYGAASGEEGCSSGPLDEQAILRGLGV